jgi:hypothetical protein
LQEIRETRFTRRSQDDPDWRMSTSEPHPSPTFGWTLTRA